MTTTDRIVSMANVKYRPSDLLKQCPFCGGAAYIVLDDLQKDIHECYISCIDCGAQNSGVHYGGVSGSTETEAIPYVISRWNKRI